MEGDFIPLKEASFFTPYSQEYLSLLARRGKINATKIGRVWYIEKSEILKYHEEHKEDIVRYGSASRNSKNLIKNSRYPAAVADSIFQGKKRLKVYFRWSQVYN